MGVLKTISVLAVWRQHRLVACLMLLATTGVVTSLALTGTDGPARAAMLRDPLAVLGDRSPGARPDGALFQTKSLRDLLARTPRERVLSTVRRRPSEPSFVPAEVVPAEPVAAIPESFDTASAGDAPFLPAGVFPFPGGVIGGGVIGGGGVGGGGTGGGGSSGGGGGGTTPTNPGTPGEPVGSVPEPATWLSLILGFGLAGAALRRRNGRRFAGVA